MATRSTAVVRGRLRMRTGAHAHPRARVRITARAAVLLVVVMLLAVALVYPARLYVQQLDRIGELEKQTQILTIANQNLAGQVQKLNDPVYQEKLARECLGMVKAGETAFVVVQKGGDPKPAAC